MEAKTGGNKLQKMARKHDLSMRDFLLDKLANYEDIGAMAKSMKVTAVSIRAECARAGIVEVKAWRLDDGATTSASVTYFPRQAINPNFLPVAPPQ